MVVSVCRHGWVALVLACCVALGATGAFAEETKNVDLAALVAKVDPSVVSITLDNESQGSGFVIAEGGLVATNYHVIEGAKYATVTFPTTKQTGYIDGFVAIDPSRDLAIVHITMGPLPMEMQQAAKSKSQDPNGNSIHDLADQLPPNMRPHLPRKKNSNTPPGMPPNMQPQTPNGFQMPDNSVPNGFGGQPKMPNRGEIKNAEDLNARMWGKPGEPLRLADNPPAKGERVFAFGSPMGLSGSVSDGIVACIRPGGEVAATLKKLTHRDIYHKKLGYVDDAEWIQTTAPISPGNSGGPLVNAAGEVVGINTWVCAVGQNLNFSLSVAYLRKFAALAGKSVQPLTSLPAPRPERERERFGDVEKTMKYWVALNKFKAQENDKINPLEKKLLAIVPIDPRNPQKGENSRNRRRSFVFEQMATVYSDYAGDVKSLSNAGVDPDIILLGVIEADVAQQLADDCKSYSSDSISGSFSDFWAKINARGNRSVIARLRTARDLLRVSLCERYDKQFPSVEETARNPNAGLAQLKGEDESESSGSGSESQGSVAEEKEETAEAVALRVWTDKTGKHQIQAKFVGLEAGKVKLEKADGTVLRVTISTLSEADQRFIGIVP